MKLNIKSCLVAGMFSLTMASCSLLGPIDDIHPENVLDDETVITDARSAEIAVMVSMKVESEKFYLQCIVFAYRSYAKLECKWCQKLLTGDIQDDNVIVEETYIFLYYIINQANSVLAALDKDIKGLSEEENLNYQREAKFNRAMANFMLLRLYGEFVTWTLSMVSCFMTLLCVTIPRKRERLSASVTHLFLMILKRLKCYR